MMEDIGIGSRVKSNREGRTMKAEEVGTVVDILGIDSGFYLVVQLESGECTAPSAESYWNLYND